MSASQRLTDVESFLDEQGADFHYLEENEFGEIFIATPDGAIVLMPGESVEVLTVAHDGLIVAACW